MPVEVPQIGTAATDDSHPLLSGRSSGTGEEGTLSRWKSAVEIKSYYTLVWPSSSRRSDLSTSPVPRHQSADRRQRPYNSGGGGGRRNVPPAGGAAPGDQEDELASKMLQIQSKRFYLDVKQNRRGRFLKIAEIGAGGRKTRIAMAMSAAATFRDHLSEFGEFYATLGPGTGENLPEDGRIKSATLTHENRRYYLDLKENNRGRFLRVTQTIVRGPRNVIVIPAQGIVEFRDTLSGLLDEFGTDDLSSVSGRLPEARQFRVENKMFYFDMGQNSRGVFMRISEVKPNFRTAVTIPERSWTQFRDILVDICDQMESGTGQGEVGGVIDDDDEEDDERTAEERAQPPASDSSSPAHHPAAPRPRPGPGPAGDSPKRPDKSTPLAESNA